MQTQTRAPSRLAWRGFVRAVGILDLVLLTAAAVWLTDIEAAAIALGLFVGIVLMRFRKVGVLGFIVVGLLFVNVAAWMLPGALSNISHNEAFLDTALPGALAILSIAGALGVIGYWFELDQRTGRVLSALVVVAMTGLVVVSFGSTEDVVARPGEISLDMKDVKFVPENLAAESGQIEMSVSNGDLFWHTFTIGELDVDVRVPVRGERRIMFSAPAGTYEFVCAIPGHTQAGMKGTLTAR